MTNSRELFRAVTGPVMLITFGTLMAISSNGGLDFRQTWPVLVIVYGLLKLAGSLKGGEQA